MRKKLKIGIIGCGDISVAHARGIALSGNAELAFTMDVNRGLAQELAGRYGADYTDSLEELLTGDIDAVYVAVPHYLHARITLQAAAAGKHVMVEKPIATTVKDAEKMITACAGNNVKLSVCFVSRYRPDILKARSLVQRGVIGKVIGIQVFFVAEKKDSYWSGGFSGRARTDWRRSKAKSGGGTLIMNLSHDLDYIRYITGLEIKKARSEYGNFRTPGVEVEDLLASAVRYDNGAVGSLYAGSCLKGGLYADGALRNTIYGTEGQIVLGKNLKVFTSKKINGLEANRWNDIGFGEQPDPRQKYVEDFAGSVLRGKAVPIPGKDGLQILRAALMIYGGGK